MPATNLYEALDSSSSSSKTTLGEKVQIGLLSVIILVFFAIAASNTVALLVSALHR